MAELKFAVLFSAVDQLSDKLGAISNAVSRLSDIVTAGSERVGELGRGMVEWGEKVGIATAVLSEGADRFHEWSKALGEPAYAMQQSMATTAAMIGLAGDALGEIKERAIAFSSTHPYVTAERWAAGFTRMRGIFQETARAIGAEDTAAMLARLGVEGGAAANPLAASWANLRSPAQQTGDALMRTIQLFGLAPESAQQLALAVGRLGGTAAQTNTLLRELLALVGQATRQFGGGRGAMMFNSKIREMVQRSAESKSTIDWSHGLAQVHAGIARMPPGDRLEALRKMSATDPAAMATFLDHLDAVAGKQRQLADNAGILGNAYGTATRNASDATALRHQNISNLYDAVYSPALSTIAGWLVDRTDAAQGAPAAAEHHSAIARYAALSLTALGGAYYSLQGLATFGTMTAFAGKGVQALGAPALSVVAYEVYKHWDKFAPLFEHLWARVKGIFKSAAVEISKHWDAIRKVFSGAVNWLKTTGLNMMKSFGEGILAGAEYPFKAAWNLARKVGGLFHFHSPPDYGPLREAVLNFRFGEELARHVTPAPIIAPARELAAGIAGAAPRGAAGSGSITINYSPQVIIQGAGSAKDEFVKELRQHADELVRIVRQKLAREALLSFT